MNPNKSSEASVVENILASRAQRPREVTYAVRAMWALWAVGSLYLIGVYVLALTVGALEKLNQGVPPILGIGYVMVIMSLGLLVRSVARGKNWARYVYGAIALLAVLILILSLFITDKTILRSVVSIALATAYSVVLWWLFHPTSAQWFKS